MTFAISSTHIPRNEIQAAIHAAASYADVEYVLRQTTSYCDCGSDDTVKLLWEMLEILDERKHTDTNVEYRIITEKIEALLDQCGRAGYGCWFVYGMEHSGWLTHGSNIFDLWLTSEGKSLLKALRGSASLSASPSTYVQRIRKRTRSCNLIAEVTAKA